MKELRLQKKQDVNIIKKGLLELIKKYKSPKVQMMVIDLYKRVDKTITQ